MEKLGSMSLNVAISSLLISALIFVATSETDGQDAAVLNSLKAFWQNVPPTWNSFGDPCSNYWEGVVCSGSRVIALKLSSLGIQGRLTGDIQELSELQTLDLSYNKGMTGPIPAAIGKLSKLTNLILMGCNFNGIIPDSIGSLSDLVFLSLNSNSFRGRIPNSIGNLSSLYWLDLADNQLSGTIPVSKGVTPGLDLLVNTKHFHFGMNQLSGPIPSQLFQANMTLIHLLLDNNQLTGSIPTSIGLVQTLEVVRLDWNSLSGTVPLNINRLTNVTDLLISNNELDGPMPDLSNMNYLSYLDMSNNSFLPSDFPSWVTTLPSLTTLIMEGIQIQGTIPVSLFSLPQLQTVVISWQLTDFSCDTLDIGATHGTQLRLVNLQNNNISAYTTRPGVANIELVLDQNPFCEDAAGQDSICLSPQIPNILYTTRRNCAPVVCDTNEVSSPNCLCAYPYFGTLVFRSTKFSNYQNSSYYEALEQKLITTFHSQQILVDSVSLSNITRDPSNYLKMTLEIFPLDEDRFDRTAVSTIGFILSNQTFKPPPTFGPFYFIGSEYSTFADKPKAGSKKILTIAAIIGIAVGGSAFLLILLYLGVTFCCCKKRSLKSVETVDRSGPSLLKLFSDIIFRLRVIQILDISHQQLKQSEAERVNVAFLKEIKTLTNNFSEANEIGSGSYGKVYRGTLTDGQLIAVKRAKHGSRQGNLEFNTEIELLSRVHHKNLVSLLGFCLENEELILIYEYVPNGTLNESLSGKSGVQLDWWRRIKVALGAARGVAYLHELASPPIIHRDIKSNNILLDHNLNAKVSDFGLSRPLNDDGTDYIITEVKGTIGYVDPEYYMTQKLTEKCDVYSFGILLLELVTGRPPIDKGRYIVRQVNTTINRTQDLYGLHELLDPNIITDTAPKGFQKYIDLALSCVQESGSDRPQMGEVVKKLEDILEMAGVNPYSDTSTSSASFVNRNFRHLYGDEFMYTHNSGTLPR